MEAYVCTGCGQTKLKGQFYARRDRPKGVMAECKDCFKSRKRRDYKDNPEYHAQQKEWSRRTHSRIKAEVIAAYGGACACCGESEPAFLTIDHTDGSGAERRRNGEGSGGSLYFNLRKWGFPKDVYQLLCFNCNCAKRQTGQCPHQTGRHAVKLCA